MIQTGGSGQLSMEGKSHVGRNNLESFWKLSWAARMGRIRYMGWGDKGVRALFARLRRLTSRESCQEAASEICLCGGAEGWVLTGNLGGLVSGAVT